MKTNLLAWAYLILAVFGAVLPSLANIDFIKEYGSFNLPLFINLANINPAAQSLSRDLLIGASAIFAWIISESRRLRIGNMWVVFLGTFLIAFAFAAPFFLYLRERRLEELKNEGFNCFPINN